MYEIIESWSSGPYLELFVRNPHTGWIGFGNQADEYQPIWDTYSITPVHLFLHESDNIYELQ